MHTEFRQGIISYPSSLGEQTFLVVSGSYISLVPNNQLYITFAFSEENYLLVESVNVANAWGPLLINTDYWLYWDINRTTGARTFGTTLLEPIVSTTKPTGVNNLHWFNPNTQKMYVYQYSTWREKIRVFAARVNNGVFTPMGDVSYAGTQVGLDNQHTISGRIVVNSQGKTIIRQNGTLLTSDSNTFINGSYTNIVRPEAQIVYGQATEHIDPFRVVKLSRNGQISIANYNDIHISALAINMEKCLSGQTGLLSIRGVISNPDWNFTEVGLPLWVGANGTLTDINPFLIDPTTYPTNKPPVANVLTANSVYFNASMGGKGLDGPAASSTSLATTTVYGRAKASVTPTNPNDPIWVGTNDPRLVQYVHPVTHPSSLIATSTYGILTGSTLDIQLQQLANRNLNSLIDVVVPSPGTNTFLTYDGTNWIATNITTSPYISDLLDVTISGATSGQVLTYNGTQWVNSTLPTISLIGDATGSGSTTMSITLATVNSNIGSFGNSTTVIQFTVNNKGLVTAAAQVPIDFPPSGGGDITSVALSGGTTGFTFSNSPITTTGTFGMDGNLFISNGGTNASTANDAFNNLAPSQIGFEGGTTLNPNLSTIWACGYGNWPNIVGTFQSILTQLPSTNWKQVSCGYSHTLATKNDGTLWSWGFNYEGELGFGDIIDRSSPVQVGSSTDWSQASAGSYLSAVIKTDGTLWTWGHNNQGQLGHGGILTISSPVQVGSLTDWQSVTAGSTHTMAIKTNNTLWAWGSGAFGKLGTGSQTNFSSPIQIGLLADWSRVTCSYAVTVAIKTDGTIWSWGRNQHGQLGDETIISKSSPIQVGSLTNWSTISCGYSHSAATKTDGTLWVWGRNEYGQLGNETTISTSSPIQLGASTDWSNVICGNSSTHAHKTDGSIWAWGDNYSGQLGDGTFVDQSSPIQIGSLTNWQLLTDNMIGAYFAVIYNEPHDVRYFLSTDSSDTEWEVLDSYVTSISQVGILPVDSGGTGQSNATDALLALMPPYNGPTKYVLTTNGQDVYWAPISSLP